MLASHALVVRHAGRWARCASHNTIASCRDVSVWVDEALEIKHTLPLVP